MQATEKEALGQKIGKRKTLEGIKFCSKGSGFYSLTRKNIKGLGLDCLPPSFTHTSTRVGEREREVERKADKYWSSAQIHRC